MTAVATRCRRRSLGLATILNCWPSRRSIRSPGAPLGGSAVALELRRESSALLGALAPLLATLALGLTVLGCGSAANPAMQLKEAVEEYTRSMRWGHIERAAVYVPESLRKAWIQQRRQAQAEIQVHEYDIRAVEHTAGTDKARVIVLAVWSRPADPVARQQLLAQEWRYRERLWTLLAQTEIKVAPQQQAPVSPAEAF